MDVVPEAGVSRVGRLLDRGELFAGAVAALTVVAVGSLLLAVALLLSVCPWERPPIRGVPSTRGARRARPNVAAAAGRDPDPAIRGGDTVSRLASLVHSAGPEPKSCACWHLVTAHSPECTFHGCGCPRARWSWSLAGGVGWLLGLLRGGR